MLTKHVLDADHITEMRNSHFQNGFGAWMYLRTACFRPPSLLRLREMNKDFDDIDIVHDIGINHNTIKLLCKRIRTVNGKRPAGMRKTNDEMAEKVLEQIFTTSKHFSEGALTEYNALPANRQFQTPPGPLTMRDLVGLEAHYHSLWENAVNARLPGFHSRAPQSRPATSTRNTLESGLSASESSASTETMLFAGSADTYVPRPVSPSATLSELAHAAEDPSVGTLARLAHSRGTTTTTDWALLSKDELCQVVSESDDGNLGNIGFEALWRCSTTTTKHLSKSSAITAAVLGTCVESARQSRSSALTRTFSPSIKIVPDGLQLHRVGRPHAVSDHRFATSRGAFSRREHYDAVARHTARHVRDNLGVKLPDRLRREMRSTKFHPNRQQLPPSRQQHPPESHRRPDPPHRRSPSLRHQAWASHRPRAARSPCPPASSPMTSCTTGTSAEHLRRSRTSRPRLPPR